MAGLNTRFHDAGFDIPKYLLPWEDGAIITEILKNLIKGNNFNEIILLPNKRDSYFKSQLIEAIKPIGLTEKNVYYIGDTSGQAHTALIGATLQKNQLDSFIIHNADTIITNRDINAIEETFNSCSAWVDVFVANSPSYSYVKTDNFKVVDIVEKKAISPYASSGLYCFKDALMYEQEFYKAKEKILDRELYVSDILKNMIQQGQTVLINELKHDNETIVLGSPQEYGIELAKKKIGLR